MKALPLPTFSLDQFTWDKKNRRLITEASTLCHFGNMFGQVWSDSCDLGLAIESHKTGDIFRFALDGEQADKEGEITSWMLKPVDKRCPVRFVIIFND
jgi:hypothetical protein